MVQREVADRFFAEPSTKAYGAVSVLVQLAARRTGFHPVARTVFRPPPNVDSALVAFRRVAAAGATSSGSRPSSRPRSRTGARRCRTRSRSPGSPTASSAAAALESIGRPAGDAGRGARAGGVRGARPRRSVNARARVGEDQSRARRRPGPRGREARGRDRAAADRPRRPRRDRGRAEPAGDRLRRRHARSRRARPRSPRPQASSRAGGRRSRSGSRSRPASAAAAPTPRPRFGSPTTRFAAPLPGERLRALAATLGADVPFFLTAGPQLGRGDGSELEPLELPQDYWVVLALPHGAGKDSTAAVYRSFDERDGAQGWEDRRARSRAGARRRAAPARPRRPAAERPRLLAAGRRAAPSWARSAPTSAAPARPSTGSSITGATPRRRGVRCGAPRARG